jgi:hypothetical protein
VSLKLDKYTFNFGDRLEGTLTVSSDEEIDATEIRVEILCLEKKKESVTSIGIGSRGGIRKSDQWETNLLYYGNSQASGPIRLTVGYKGEFPFVTDIVKGSPSCVSDTRRVLWTIKGVIAIKGRPDVTSPTSDFQVIARAT